MVPTSLSLPRLIPEIIYIARLIQWREYLFPKQVATGSNPVSGVSKINKIGT